MANVLTTVIAVSINNYCMKKTWDSSFLSCQSSPYNYNTSFQAANFAWMMVNVSPLKIPLLKTVSRMMAYVLKTVIAVSINNYCMKNHETHLFSHANNHYMITILLLFRQQILPYPQWRWEWWMFPCIPRFGSCSIDSACCKYKQLLYEASWDSSFLSCQSSLHDCNTSSFQAAIGAMVCVWLVMVFEHRTIS
jgi:hypothetical protein